MVVSSRQHAAASNAWGQAAYGRRQRTGASIIQQLAMQGKRQRKAASSTQQQASLQLARTVLPRWTSFLNMDIMLTDDPPVPVSGAPSTSAWPAPGSTSFSKACAAQMSRVDAPSIVQAFQSRKA